MKERDYSIDFTKGILITLMVIFHLGHFHQKYPDLTSYVYSFHMSGFLLISGYLFSTNKVVVSFCRSLRTIIVPYFIFELLYLYGLSILGKTLGASNDFNGNFLEILRNIFISPIGTYWYLHTLVICMLICFTIFRIIHSTPMSSILLSGISLFGLSIIVDGLKWENIMYFLIGVGCRSLQNDFLKTNSSLYSGFAFILIIIASDSFGRGTLTSLALTFTSLSFLTAIYKFVPKNIGGLFVLLGKNSLAIVLFSPFFAIPTKFIIGLFSFDSTAIVWMLTSTCFICAASLISMRLLDRTGFTQYICGKKYYMK